MRCWFTRLRQVSCILVVSALAGCATTADFDADKLARVKTVAVAAPSATKYLAASASAPMVIPGGSVLGAAIGGALGGMANASTDKRALTFNDLVLAKVGDTGLNRRLVDGVKAELQKQGYEVKEIDLSQAGMPKLAFKTHLASLEGPAYDGADAIAVVNLYPSYFAPGPLNSFRRQVYGEVTLFDPRSHAVAFRRQLMFQKISDDYSYFTYSQLLEDLPRAVQGVDEAAMSLVPAFGVALQDARQMIRTSSAPATATATATATAQ